MIDNKKKCIVSIIKNNSFKVDFIYYYFERDLFFFAEQS